MSRRVVVTRTGGPTKPPGGLRAYLTRFLTSWVAEDPEPSYSALDRADGLGQHPDPVCQPLAQLPESPEVAWQAQLGRPVWAPDQPHGSAVAGRGGR